MYKLKLCVALLFLALAASSISAQDQNKKDAETLIKAAHFLEDKPLDKDAKNVRGWAVNYVIETDQVSVIVCGGDLMSPLLDKKNKTSVEMIGQYTIGMAAF